MRLRFLMFVVLLSALSDRTKSDDDGELDEDPSLIVDAPAGLLRGKRLYLPDGQTVKAFLGIPYSKAPIGVLRFQPPVEKERWNGIVDATSFGPVCHQPVGQEVWDILVDVDGRRRLEIKKLEDFIMSEDCLSINVYAPEEIGSELIPVMFYIHGGSYFLNAGRLYPGEKLTTRGLIIVTFNYRLGPLGFLSTGDEIAPGNYGLLDQVEALRWVQKNIRTFGGDPDHVTIFGNSAGGASVTFHLLSPLTKGLFSGAIAQSGCCLAPWAIQSNPVRHAKQLAQNLNCPTEDSNRMIECLKNQSADKVVQDPSEIEGLLLPFAPVVDAEFGGTYLPGHPEDLVRAGLSHPVPVIIGITRDEVSVWFQDPEIEVEILKSKLDGHLKEIMSNKNVPAENHAAITHAVNVQYLKKRGITDRSKKVKTMILVDFISDVGLKAPCTQQIQLMVENSAHHAPPAFLYEFHYHSSDDVKIGKQSWMGAYHESELQYLFGEPHFNYNNTLRTENDRHVSDVIMTLWTNFAYYGHPTPPGEREALNITWRPYTRHHRGHLRIQRHTKMADSSHSENLLFWNVFLPILSDYPMTASPCIDADVWWSVWAAAGLSVVLLLTSVAFTLYVVCLRRNMIPTHAPLSPESSTNV